MHLCFNIRFLQSGDPARAVMSKMNRDPKDTVMQSPQARPPRLRTCGERVEGCRAPEDGEYTTSENVGALGLLEPPQMLHQGLCIMYFSCNDIRAS
jgi:hypothetical protein